MKVKVFARFEDEVETDVGLSEITAAILEAGANKETRHQILTVLNHILVTTKAFTDEEIAKLTDEVRTLVADHFDEAAKRFRPKA